MCYIGVVMTYDLCIRRKDKWIIVDHAGTITNGYRKGLILASSYNTDVAIINTEASNYCINIFNINKKEWIYEGARYGKKGSGIGRPKIISQSSL